MENWVDSMGGPLVVVPVSGLREWGGCMGEWVLVGEGTVVDDYDRACAVRDYAGVIEKNVLVLGGEPATTRYLSERRAFVRWIGADSEEELVAAAEALLDDPRTPWEEYGVWETDGAAVLMDSAEAGADLGTPYPGGAEMPQQADVDISAGRWRVGVHHSTEGAALVGVVRLLAC
ncbi:MULTISPECIES: Imm21 family immunity protein [unclassified Streptomyces]|uniref:Imm21 family immunity protein n=1 Tax=unclassified Streptomyces TaxID=2593676 RepID=UPI0035DA5BC6